MEQNKLLGKINWKHSPTHTYERTIKPHAEKLRVLELLFWCADSEHDLFNGYEGIRNVVGEAASALAKFEEGLADSIEKTILDNQFGCGGKNTAINENRG